MIVFANEEFATGLRLAGVKNSYSISTKAQLESIMKELNLESNLNEFIIATQKVFDNNPVLARFQNIIVFPDTLSDFSKIDDLKKITRAAIGSDIDI
jgi:vacuolar-type H+-ATPase subunit F/Vma7